jgi:hypothetical protein
MREEKGFAPQSSTIAAIQPLSAPPRLQATWSGPTWRGSAARAARVTLAGGRGGLRHRPDHPPPPLATLGDAPRAVRPRRALNAASARGTCGGPRRCVTASPAMAPARRLGQRAQAPMARVRGRDPPVPRRTSEGARPTALVAAAPPRSMVPRVAAPGTPSATVVSWRATPTAAVTSGGRLRRRRSSRQRRQAGATGAARGSPRQASQRGPWDPAPARSRVPPSSGRAARSGLTWRGRQPSQRPDRQPPGQRRAAAPPAPSAGGDRGPRRGRLCPRGRARPPSASARASVGPVGAWGPRAARPVAGPLRRPIARTVQQGVTPRPGRAQHHAHRAVVHRARRAPGGAGAPRRGAALVHNAGGVAHQPRRRGPACPAPQGLNAIGRGVAAACRPWPAGVARSRPQQPPPVGQRPRARRRARACGGQAALTSVPVRGSSGDHRGLLVTQVRGRFVPPPQDASRSAGAWNHATTVALYLPL